MMMKLEGATRRGWALRSDLSSVSSNVKESPRARASGKAGQSRSALPLFVFLFFCCAGILFLSSRYREIWGIRTLTEQTRQKETCDLYEVIVVGAGAAGLTAAYTLQRHGVHKVKILEASQVFGGRVRPDNAFADYPLDLGGTFVFDRRAPKQIAGIDVYPEDQNNRLEFVKFNKAVYDTIGKKKYSYKKKRWTECMWVNNSWYNFFADYIAPKEPETIVYGCQVNRLDYRGSTVEVGCGELTFCARHVVVTVPLSVLQDNDIEFMPPLPEQFTRHHKIKMWQGFKILFEFSKKFYWDVFYWSEEHRGDGESDFWDYSIAQNSSRHILAGYIMGAKATEMVKMDDSKIFELILKRLDGVFKGKASKYYIKHQVINWSKEPYVRGTYANDPLMIGAQSIANKVFFAGEAFPLAPDSGWVHVAAFSGKSAANKILQIKTNKTIVRTVDRNQQWGAQYAHDEIV